MNVNTQVLQTIAVDDRLKPSDFRVLCLLLSTCNALHEVHLYQYDIASAIHAGHTSVFESIRRLRKAGVLETDGYGKFKLTERLFE